jgi:hypothetical protein
MKLFNKFYYKIIYFASSLYQKNTQRPNESIKSKSITEIQKVNIYYQVIPIWNPRF